MATAEDRLRLALEFVSEGARAKVPRALARRAFRTRSFLTSTERIHRRALDWTRGPGIQGLGIGEKITGGKKLRQLALRVYVEKKKPLSKVRNRVPRTVAVPRVGVVHTDVVEIGRVRLESETGRLRPAPPGCGLGHPDVTVGTFGCLVKRNDDESGLYILSNSHVLADSGIARVGDEIVQPGVHDGGRTPGDVIATLNRFVPFDYGRQGYPNLVDAAIAKVRRKSGVQREIRILGIAPAGISRTLHRGMQVRKVGRTTDLTTGEILDVAYRVRLRYKAPGYRSRHYRRRGHRRHATVGLRDLVLCTRFTDYGDSGAAVLNSRNRIVGLHFAGSASNSIFCRAEHVFSLLDVRLA